MKLFQIFSIFLILGFTVPQKSKGQITINGKITGKVPDVIQYTLPINGISFFGFEDAVKPDAAGNFQIILSIEKACFIELSNEYESYGTLIVEPDMTYSISINTNDKANSLTVESDNKKAQELYNKLVNRSMIAGHFEIEATKYLKDTTETKIKQSIKKSEEVEIKGFKVLYDSKIISKDFYELVSNDRSYFYKGVQGSVAFINFLSNEKGQNKLSKKQYSALWQEIFQSNSPSNPEILRSPWFFYYTELFLKYNEFIKDATAISTISEIREKNMIHTHNIEIAKKYLSGAQLEYYYAAYIYYQAINKDYEKELVSLFEQFKKEYPSSKYSHFIGSEIIPIVAFHKKQSEPLNENIKFINDSETYNSLKEVVKAVKGKRIYVDVWATWCSPCKEEFKYNPELYKLLKSKDVTLLYLSIDKDDREKQWREMVNYYNLEGLHIRARSKLYADLQNIRGGDTFSIPWHILTDENGNIIKKYASEPSQIETLKKQLNEN